MKHYNSLFVSFFLFVLSYNAIAQDTVEKKYFDSNNTIGGDVLISKSTIKIEGTKAYKIFEIDSPVNGLYYLNAWLMGGELDGFGTGKFMEYDLTVNDEKQTVKFKSTKNSWHNTTLEDGKTKEKKTVKLKKGLNTIAFSCNIPEIPNIEFIRLSQEKSKSEIDNNKYSQFVADIKNKMQERIKNPKALRDTTLSLRNGIILDNPAGNYFHHLNVNFKYTTYQSVYLTAGQQVYITTNAPDGYQYVLEVFSFSNPESNTWSGLSYNGYISLSCTVPFSDTYFIRLRAFQQNTEGLVNVDFNGQYYFTNCPVTGSGFSHVHETPCIYNYFTCNLTGDSRLWIEDNYTIPGKIRAFNDDYISTGHFNWGFASRVKKDLSTSVGAVLVSAYGSNNPIGICDLYIKCENSTIMPSFPLLKADDAIKSAPATNQYNCISWSGGIINYWEWPLLQSSDYYIEDPASVWYDTSGEKHSTADALASFDHYYDSVRYAGAMTYTREEATESNSIVDLWAFNNQFTHASVTKPGNNHPHGYNWESKPGGLMRTFHPRYALDSSSYGFVTQHYIPKTENLRSVMLLDESIAEGLSVIENVNFTASEKSVLNNKINSIDINQIDAFEKKYTAWKKTWENPEVAIQSDPRMYAKSKEYQEFIDYCIKQGKDSWPLVFDKFQQGDFFSINAIEELTLPENKAVLDSVKKENKLRSCTESGAQIVRSPQTNMMKYIKALLNGSANYSSINTGLDYSNSYQFEIIPNPALSTSQISFYLENDSKVSAQVIDLNGCILSNIVNEQNLQAGNCNYNLNVPALYKGICLVKLIVNNTVNVKRIIIQ